MFIQATRIQDSLLKVVYDSNQEYTAHRTIFYGCHVSQIAVSFQFN